MHELGADSSEIAGAAQLSIADVEQHFTRCVPNPASNDDPITGSDEHLQRLLQNSVELYHSGVLLGNMVAASSALAVRLRALAEIGRRSEMRSERKNLLDGADPRIPATWGSELRRFLVQMYDSVLNEHRALATSSEPQSETKTSRRKRVEIAHP
jgi:hypothetical protein